MNWLEVEGYRSGGWIRPHRSSAAHYCAELEKGAILYFPTPPFELSKQDIDYLISLRPTESLFHKNISYRPRGNVLRGMRYGSNRDQVRDVMRRFSTEAQRFISTFLRPYSTRLQMDYASFRPLEEKGRDLPLRKSNALLHIDSFPTRPTKGARILRLFTNINPVKERQWMVANCFEPMAIEFLKSRSGAFTGRLPIMERFKKGLESFGLPVRSRPPYDQFMLEFHHWMKANVIFQSATKGRQACSFPPLTSWVVFTDGLPHAVLAGQFVLEQTFLVPVDSLVAPEASPIRIFERLIGSSVIGPRQFADARRAA